MERKNTRKVVAGILLGSVLAGQVSLGASRAEAFVPLVVPLAVAVAPAAVTGVVVAATTVKGLTVTVVAAAAGFSLKGLINEGKARVQGTSGESPE